jgi:hypothetical protein
VHTIAHRIVRLTCIYEPYRDQPHLLRVTVVVGAVVRGQLVEFQQTVGDRWDFPEAEGVKTLAQAEAVLGQAEAQGWALRLQVCTGRFEE